jgi:hypothetical protein
MQLFMAVPMTPSAAGDIAPHLHGVLVLVTGNKFISGVVVTGDKVIAGVVVTSDKVIAGVKD